MNDSPLVTVIVPMFNSERFAKDCIESILNQTLRNLELIVLDDHSSDRSYQLCRDLTKDDPRARVIRNETNIGPGPTRNRGILLSKGAYVTFVDSDDYIHPDMYQSMTSLANSHNADIVRCRLVRTGNRQRSALQARRRDPRVLSGDELRAWAKGYFGPLPEEDFSELPSMSPCTAIYRGDLLRRGVAIFPSERGIRSEDRFFNLDYLRASDRCVLTDDAFYYYYFRPGSTSLSYSSPASMCETLLSMAGNDDELLLRTTRTMLTAVKEASLQLAAGDYSFSDGARILKHLERELDLPFRLADYPISKLPFRERLFAWMTRTPWGWPTLLLAHLYHGSTRRGKTGA